MKKLIIIIVGLLLTINVNAQVWHFFPGKMEADEYKELFGYSMSDDSVEAGLFVFNLLRAVDNLIHAPSIIVNLNSWDMNSAGGIETSYSIVNGTVKRIKYIYITSCFLNSVGDVCTGDFGERYMKERLIGPIGPRPTLKDDMDVMIDKLNNCTGTYSSDTPSFYCSVADRMKVVSIKVQYFDGTVKVYKGKQVKEVYCSAPDEWAHSECNPLAPINDD